MNVKPFGSSSVNMSRSLTSQLNRNPSLVRMFDYVTISRDDESSIFIVAEITPDLKTGIYITKDDPFDEQSKLVFLNIHDWVVVNKNDIPVIPTYEIIFKENYISRNIEEKYPGASDYITGNRTETRSWVNYVNKLKDTLHLGKPEPLYYINPLDMPTMTPRSADYAKEHRYTDVVNYLKEVRGLNPA